MAGPRILILGEAIVDLVCERPAASFDDADAFVPHFGGAPANVAVTAARRGAGVALAGGVGADPWGDWLARRLASERIALDWFTQAAGVRTPVSFAIVAADGEPSYDFHGDRLAPGVPGLASRIAEAVDAGDGLFFTTNTMLAADEREVTLAARRRAIERGLPVVFDPNLRPGRWPDADAAAALARECLPGALLVKCNAAEARHLTGEDDAGRAAEALVTAGAASAVVTLGPDGALLRGAAGQADAAGVPARPISTIGAGDTFSGVLLAALAAAAFDPAAIAAALPAAIEESARATERWGGVA